MIHGRVGFDAALLGNGTVLAVGDDRACIPGGAETGSELAEIYDPEADRWSAAQSLNKPRKSPATVRLPDGSAIVIGGINDDDVPFSSTKIYSAANGAWADGPLLGVARGQPLAATIAGGRVLVLSDVSATDTAALSTTEIYDPSSGSWSRGASLTGLRLHTLVALADGRALGLGQDAADAEPSLVAVIYDPAADAWRGIDAPTPRIWFEIVALQDGGALAIGGNDGGELFGGDGSVTARVDRLDPETGHWSPVASMPTARASTTSVVLADGRVLVAGGTGGQGGPDRGPALTRVEVFDPESDAWTVADDLREPRYDAQLVTLRDGDVLLLGGAKDFNTEFDTPWCPAPMTSVERFTPGP